MTCDAYWDAAQELREKEVRELDNYFWIIRNDKEEDMCRAKQYLTEEDAWKAVIQKPFDQIDYKNKGWHAVKIDVKAFRNQLEKMQKSGYF